MKLRAYYALVPLLGLLAWKASATDPTSYERLDGSSEPLRAAFNADAGKVRVLMLVAPT